MQIRHMMHDKLAIVGPDMSFSDMLRAYRAMGSRLVYVTDADRRLLGVVSSYDILRAMLPFYLDSNLVKALPDDDSVIRQAFAACKDLPVADIMTKKCITVGPENSFLEAEAIITEQGVNALPVIDADGILIGEVTRRAILKYLAGRCGLDSEA
ncbi:MAG: HPP family protein [Solidesulfovibrio sp.]